MKRQLSTRRAYINDIMLKIVKAVGARNEGAFASG